MSAERWNLQDKRLVSSIKNPIVISGEYIDNYGNHLNQGLALKLFAAERRRIFGSASYSSGVLSRQFAEYTSQVFEGEQLIIASDTYLGEQQLLFHQRLRRFGDDAVSAFVVNMPRYSGLPPNEPNAEPTLLEIKSSYWLDDGYLDSDHMDCVVDPSLVLRIFEDERIKMFEQRGLSWERLRDKFGVMGFVREQNANYYSPLSPGEEINVITALFLSGARLIFHHQIDSDGKIVMDDLVKVVLVNLDGRPKRIPPPILKELQK